MGETDEVASVEGELGGLALEPHRSSSTEQVGDGDENDATGPAAKSKAKKKRKKSKGPKQLVRMLVQRM